ncbi:MAG: tRNA pseudouridine(38-40) synthase TruA [Bacteroidaceae bacterium]|nr:tRNA pseudouridine(38-40) synthase TruA [Bacteroidaceae bacterium]
MRYFIQLSYDGTAYHGWQRQPNGTSVQETLEEALSTLLRQPIEVVGAGRTDAGVHARMMVAHMDYPVELDTMQLVYKLNKLLPQDIAVQRIWPVSDDMHARFSATSRTYHYYIHTRKDPFLRGYSWLVTFPLDFDLMNQAARRLLDFEDFTSFSKVNTDTKTNLCNITEARWDNLPLTPFQGGGMTHDENLEGGCWVFTITANRFLRNMVRAIVGTLVEVGRKRMTIDEFCRVIEQKNRCSAGESVPGHGLFLVDVSYGANESSRSNMKS